MLLLGQSQSDAGLHTDGHGSTQARWHRERYLEKCVQQGMGGSPKLMGDALDTGAPFCCVNSKRGCLGPGQSEVGSKRQGQIRGQLREELVQEG